jgi:hypothetical protein
VYWVGWLWFKLHKAALCMAALCMVLIATSFLVSHGWRLGLLRKHGNNRISKRTCKWKRESTGHRASLEWTPGFKRSLQPAIEPTAGNSIGIVCAFILPLLGIGCQSAQRKQREWVKCKGWYGHGGPDQKREMSTVRMGTPSSHKRNNNGGVKPGW